MKILKSFNADPSWTLFLDRDGVINELRRGDYVKNIAEFQWVDGAIDAIVRMSNYFAHTIVVTNQQGIGKGFFTHDDVNKIHFNLSTTIEKHGGHIDAIFYAPQLSADNSPMRKPNIGMALEAQKHFPEIDFAKSIMIGDSLSDMQFAKDAGMQCVLIEHEGYAMEWDGAKIGGLREIEILDFE
jgi:histidinol-phosphate phosphatase family protein